MKQTINLDKYELAHLTLEQIEEMLALAYTSGANGDKMELQIVRQSSRNKQSEQDIGGAKFRATVVDKE